MPKYDIATRAVAVFLKASGQYSNDQIQQITGISPRTVNGMLDRAIERGYDMKTPGIIRDEYVKDAPKLGRPKKDKDKGPEL